jgi:hypothetical protein
MDRNEIISLAFNRGLSADLITEADINQATATYVKRYFSDYDADLLELPEVKLVIAYGVAFDILERIDVEATDRGINRLNTTGSNAASDNDKTSFKRNYYSRLMRAIQTMIEAGEDDGYTAQNEDEAQMNVVQDKTYSMTL